MLWAFLGLLIADACACFTQSEVVIRSVRMPLFVHALRVLVRNLLVLAHNVVVIVAVDVIFAVSPGAMALLCLPGIALWLVNSLAICVLLGAVGARFRDIPPIVASITQIAFFVTPIMWKPEQLGARVWVLPFNPFFDLLEIVRAPLLGEMPTATIWGAALGYSAVLLALAGGCSPGHAAVCRSGSEHAPQPTARRGKCLGVLPTVSRQQPQPEEDGVCRGNRAAGARRAATTRCAGVA